MAFQAKVTLSKNKKGPLQLTGFKGRVVKKGESFRTTSQEEAAYYRAQSGFVVLTEKGKLPTPKPAVIDEEEFDEDTGGDDEEESDSEEESDDDDSEEESEPKRKREVSGAYERADLKKLSKAELRALIKSDRNLPLGVKDLPKKASKREIIDLILEAQAPKDEEGDEEADDDED